MLGLELSAMYRRPLVQEKLEILNKAGLSGDDFSGTDSTTFQASTASPGSLPCEQSLFPLAKRAGGDEALLAGYRQPR